MKVITTNLLNRFWTNGVKPIITNFNEHIKTAASTTVLGHVKFGTAAGTACQGNDTRLSNARTPTSHASTGTSYGIGTASNYGHVKLSDTYDSEVTGGAAANGMAASQKALAAAYDKLNTDLSVLYPTKSSAVVIDRSTAYEYIADQNCKIMVKGTSTSINAGYVNILNKTLDCQETSYITGFNGTSCVASMYVKKGDILRITFAGSIQKVTVSVLT